MIGTIYSTYRVLFTKKYILYCFISLFAQYYGRSSLLFLCTKNISLSEQSARLLLKGNVLLLVYSVVSSCGASVFLSKALTLKSLVSFLIFRKYFFLTAVLCVSFLSPRAASFVNAFRYSS